MTFEIWTDQSGVGLMFEDLSDELRKELEDAGLKQELVMEAKTKDEAQQEFIDWCKVQCPDAKVERVDFQGRSCGN